MCRLSSRQKNDNSIKSSIIEELNYTQVNMKIVPGRESKLQ